MGDSSCTPGVTNSEPHPSLDLGGNTAQSCYLLRILVRSDEFVKERQYYLITLLPNSSPLNPRYYGLLLSISIIRWSRAISFNVRCSSLESQMRE
jgi:hypothetical protein